MRKNKNGESYMLVRQNNYRLNGLALANIHKDISAEISELVDTFVNTKPRRMVTSDWSGDEENVRLLWAWSPLVTGLISDILGNSTVGET